METKLFKIYIFVASLVILQLVTTSYARNNDSIWQVASSMMPTAPEAQLPMSSAKSPRFIKIDDQEVQRIEQNIDWLTGCENAFSQEYFILAKKYCEMAALSSDLETSRSASYWLGRLFSAGHGTQKNQRKAVDWYQKAAEFGDYESQIELKNIYYKGIYKNKIKALAWAIVADKTKPYDSLYDDWHNKGKGLDLGFGDRFHNEGAEYIVKIKSELKNSEITKAEQIADQILLKIQKNKNNTLLAQKAQKTEINNGVSNKIFANTSLGLGLPSGNIKVFSVNDIALIIGIEKYRSAPPTQFAVSDAKLVREYFRGMGMSDRNIEFLTDERATFSDIRKVLETKLPNLVKPDSRVIVYYAGHGAPNPADGTAYIIPYDGDPSYLRDTAYPLERMYEKLSELPAKEVLVVMDACFSGAGGRSVLPPGTRGLVARPKIQPQNRIIVLASTQDNQITTTLPEQQHGLFTYFFLRALQEKKKDIADIYHYLKPQVEDEAKRQNVDQSPTITPSADKLKGRFVFFN